MVQSFAPLRLAEPHPDAGRLLHCLVAALAQENSEEEAEGVRFLHNTLRVMSLVGTQCQSVRWTGVFPGGSVRITLVDGRCLMSGRLCVTVAISSRYSQLVVVQRSAPPLSMYSLLLA
jgi:hypothetical protein